MRVVILDHHDSFVFNLAQYVRILGAEAVVLRHDRARLEQLTADRIILSPGPGHPADPAYFGLGGQVIRSLGHQIPILGVCLGLQGIAQTLGGQVVRATPMHGKTSWVQHQGDSLFEAVPPRFEAMRYHSLIATALPPTLRATAWTDDGTLMALRHQTWPLVGVQFHPESVGTPHGLRIIANFLGVPIK